MNSGERVLVTGGTGFTGIHLVCSLVAGGQRVRVLARSAEKARVTLPAEVDVVVGDVTDAGAVAKAMQGQAVVFHLAAAFREAGIPDRRYHEVHVEGTRHMLNAARCEGVRRFVHCSTIGVHGHVTDVPATEDTPHRPGDIYQATKSEGEKLALEFQGQHDFPLTVARPATIYGPGDLRLLKLFRMIARRRFVMLGKGNTCLHMVHVDDLVRGFHLLADSPHAIGEAFILADRKYLPLRKVVEHIADAVGVPYPRLRLPVAPFMLAGAITEAVCVPLGIEPPIYRRRVAFFTKNRAFSIEKARRVLGYEPQIDTPSGIRDTANWYREQGLLTNAR